MAARKRRHRKHRARKHHHKKGHIPLTVLKKRLARLAKIVHKRSR